MKIFKYIGFAGILMSAVLVKAQNGGPIGYFNDALIFSQTNTSTGSTARIQGLGGTQISLGADMSSAGSNPAGLGFYNRSEFSFTPNLNFHSRNADYLDQSFGTFNNRFNFGNLGIVINNNKGLYTEEAFKGGSFAISFSRTNDFNNDFFYQGRSGGSVIDQVIEEAGTSEVSNLGVYALSAYDNYLINPEYNNADELIGYEPFVLGAPVQTERVERRGAQSQLNLSWGGNYNDRLYFGAGIGVASVRYQINRIYREDQYQNLQGNPEIDPKIQYTEFDDELEISGQGINGTFGIIARPLNFVTIGLSYMTPTYYSLEDMSGFTHNTRWNDVEVDDGGETVVLDRTSFTSDLTTSRYSLKTPGKINLGATYFLGKLGFISGDVQFVNYTSSEIRSSDFIATGDNEAIEDFYRNTINFNIGSEFRLDKFRIRGGFAHFGDPYDDGDFFDESRRNITFGVGYRDKDYFIDFAFINSKANEYFEPYFPAIQGGGVDLEKVTNTISATIGFNF